MSGYARVNQTPSNSGRKSMTNFKASVVLPALQCQKHNGSVSQHLSSFLSEFIYAMTRMKKEIDVQRQPCGCWEISAFEYDQPKERTSLNTFLQEVESES